MHLDRADAGNPNDIHWAFRYIQDKFKELEDRIKAIEETVLEMQIHRRNEDACAQERAERDA